MGSLECIHVKLDLSALIAVACADRAGKPGFAAGFHTGVFAVKMLSAGIDIKRSAIKG